MRRCHTLDVRTAGEWSSGFGSLEGSLRGPGHDAVLVSFEHSVTPHNSGVHPSLWKPHADPKDPGSPTLRVVTDPCVGSLQDSNEAPVIGPSQLMECPGRISWSCVIVRPVRRSFELLLDEPTAR